ncbi:N-methyl-L-tryptophan oxidase [Halosimplex pelagicum]|uniref:N-methyl-L-tryptophan oxidase n=1 Tax=Halosimplex pelagicum TaxID=869886 RepID=A0A7D5T7H4_9EURY|nr:N-methyl-L-tryptophan oxidase [Halosimplex pelagicum]QLH84148.1 N-methyl-L-tryptophan oxidase [Halosimplex pelagicum]
MTPSGGRYDAIVLGVGGVGSAATYHLARRGASVLGLERFDVPHARGSSHGRTRLLQRLLDADPATMALADRAHDSWRALEAETGRDLLTETGSLAVAVGGDEPVASGRRACERHGLDHESLSGADLTERFPGYAFPDDAEALYQPDGAVVASERGVVAHVAAALDAGATVRARERVVDWEAVDGGVRVDTDRDTYRADRLVVTAGAWAAQAVDALDGLLEPCRHATAWFAPGGDRSAALADDRLPPFVATVDGENFYGLPGPDLPGMKFGRADFRPTAPDALSEPTQADERPLRAFAEEYVPGAAGSTLRLSTGLVTNSPDGRFVLDTLANGRVAVAAGLSGRGYKFAPALGEILADLALDGGTDFDISGYALGRFE